MFQYEFDIYLNGVLVFSCDYVSEATNQVFFLRACEPEAKITILNRGIPITLGDNGENDQEE